MGKKSCCCCVLCWVVTIILVIVGVAMMTNWLVNGPRQVKIRLTDVTLSQFNLTANNILINYSLTFNISIRNPNKRITIYYENINVTALYQKHILDNVTSPAFSQGPKNTTILKTVLEGQRSIVLKELSDFDKENTNGVSSIAMQIYFKVKAKVHGGDAIALLSKVGCDFKLPLASAKRMLSNATASILTNCPTSIL